MDKLNLKKEWVNLFGIYLIFIIVFCIVFYKESFFVNIKFLIAMFYLFYLPGYCLTLYYANRLKFLERVVIGLAIAIAFTTIFNYYLGVAHLHVKYHIFIVPPLLIIFGLLVFYFSRKK